MRRVLVLVLIGTACSEEPAPEAPAPEPGPVEIWEPGVVYPAPRAAGVRGFLDLRGLIHAHSVYSHDACDGVPVVDGVRDQLCFDDLRDGLCKSKQDYVMLTDHRGSFDETEYPEALLYREDRGDVLVTHGGAPTASFAACPDGDRTLVLAGCEAGMMPVGLEEHAGPRESRGEVYGATTPEAAALEREHGAVVLQAHPEAFSVLELKQLPLDGFEMFNLHANMFANADRAVELIAKLGFDDAHLPVPDTALIAIMSEQQNYLERWGSVLATGRRLITTMATDCHRNTFPALMEDGERVDSYRRMMIWFSNHLLVRPEADGSFDDRSLKEALREGRLYGVFEVMGHSQGFDFRAEASGGTTEIGAEVALADGPVLHVAPGRIRGLDPTRQPPAVTVRLLRAIDGGFEEVASSTGEPLSFTPTVPGAYRAEVRLVPYHLREELRDYAGSLLRESLPWIYANPIYVR